MQGGDQARSHPGAAIRIKVNLQGVASGGGVLPPHTPVGAGLVAAEHGAHRRNVEVDVEAPLTAQHRHGVGHLEAPVVLIADAGPHRRGSVEPHGLTTGARSPNPLGVGMAGQHQDRDGRADAAGTDPVLGQRRTGPKQGIHRWSCGGAPQAGEGLGFHGAGQRQHQGRQAQQRRGELGNRWTPFRGAGLERRHRPGEQGNEGADRKEEGRGRQAARVAIGR